MNNTESGFTGMLLPTVVTSRVLNLDIAQLPSMHCGASHVVWGGRLLQVDAFIAERFLLRDELGSFWVGACGLGGIWGLQYTC